MSSNKPKSLHGNLRYDECFAKVVLETFFPEKYSSLVIDDKPDLIDIFNEVGIEVTSAVPEATYEAIAIARRIPSLDEKGQRERIAYLQSNGFKYSPYGLTHPARSYFWWGPGYPAIEDTPCKILLDTVIRKINTLNRGEYMSLKRYNLYVYSDLCIDDWMFNALSEKLEAINKTPLHYSVIYLLAIREMVVFDIDHHEFQRIATGEKLYGIGEKACALMKRR